MAFPLPRLNIWLSPVTGYSPHPSLGYDSNLWLAKLFNCGLLLAFPFNLADYMTVAYDWLFPYPRWAFDCGLWLANPIILAENLTVTYNTYPGFSFYPSWIFDWPRADNLTIIFQPPWDYYKNMFSPWLTKRTLNKDETSTSSSAKYLYQFL